MIQDQVPVLFYFIYLMGCYKYEEMTISMLYKAKK